jgi:hypothetical protein
MTNIPNHSVRAVASSSRDPVRKRAIVVSSDDEQETVGRASSLTGRGKRARKEVKYDVDMEGDSDEAGSVATDAGEFVIDVQEDVTDGGDVEGEDA